jgi:hypothetical protein
MTETSSKVVLEQETGNSENGVRMVAGDSENGVRMVESSVITRNKTAENVLPYRWKPGQSGNPAGRPRKETELAYLDAVKRALTPERVHDLIVELSARSEWRAKAFAAELALHYGAGKPVQRIETNNNGLQDILSMLGE